MSHAETDSPLAGGNRTPAPLGAASSPPMSAELSTRDAVGLSEARIVTFAERPDLDERAWEATRDAFPEYNNHGDTLNLHWSRLGEQRPDFQFCLLSRAVRAMRELAQRHGLAALIAPVRPNWKERYPLVPIEQYAAWRRPDGLLFDPWMRIHERIGGRVLRPEPRSVQITGTVAEWEGWTQMAFPQSGAYWFPGGLSTVAIDRDGDIGSYWEPNVWTHHALST